MVEVTNGKQRGRRVNYCGIQRAYGVQSILESPKAYRLKTFTPPVVGKDIFWNYPIASFQLLILLIFYFNEV